MTDAISATESYERWMASRTAVVWNDLALKHLRMSESPFVFLRATFYRWIELFPTVCHDLMDVPRYLSSLDSGGEPIVLSDRHRSLRDVALSDARDPKKFWAKMQALPRVRRVSPDVARALEQALPDADVPSTVRTRVAGIGSLGRPRFVALAAYRGGWLAREAKAWLPSDD